MLALVGLLHALMILVVGTWWTINHHTSAAIPILAIWTIWFHTSTIFKYQGVGAFTFIVEGVVMLAISTGGNRITFVDVGEGANRACAGINGGIPDSSIGTVDSWRDTSP